MNLTVKDGQNIFDVALIAYQDASRVYDIVTANSEIENINSDITGITIEYVQSFLTQKEVVKTVSLTQKPVIINSMQSIFDISLQYYGSAENVFNVITENSLENIHSDPTGIQLKYSINNTPVPIFFRKNNIVVATKPLDPTSNPLSSFILRQDGGYLLRQDGGKFIRQ